MITDKYDQEGIEGISLLCSVSGVPVAVAYYYCLEHEPDQYVKMQIDEQIKVILKHYNASLEIS